MRKLPLIVIEETAPKEFADKCSAAISKGYRISSTHCSFVDSAEYHFCSSYQAILVLPSAVVGGLEAVTDERLLREYVAVGDGTAPEPTLGCHRPEYTFDEYIDYRRSILPVIAFVNGFRKFTEGRGALSMSEWGKTWNQFCTVQDARDEADTQADALR